MSATPEELKERIEAGIPGAVVAVPIAAAINRAAPELRRPASAAATPGTPTTGPTSSPDPPDTAAVSSPASVASDSGLGAEPR